MNAYFVDYPRSFANEYTVYACGRADAGRFACMFPDTTRISRAEAIRLGWTRPRQARKDGEQWYGGFAEPAGISWHSDNPARAIHGALIATAEMIEEIADHAITT